MTSEDKKAILARKTTFMKNKTRFTSYKKGFIDALEYYSNKEKVNKGLY